MKDFSQIDWDSQVEDDCRRIVRLAVREDLDSSCDLTTVSLVDAADRGEAAVVARQPGILAGIRAVAVALDEMDADLRWLPEQEDGAAIAPGQSVGVLRGAARDLLTCERIVLNLLARLSGIATRTRRFVEAVEGTPARIYDTRKTTPGWRRLEKYAVRCGGGFNHRTGLFDAVLIKDNHLALRAAGAGDRDPAACVERVRRLLPELVPPEVDPQQIVIEVEVDTHDQFDRALSAQPDVILLDNMTPEELAEAVRRRDAAHADVQLEASGGIDLESVAAVAASGVDRISVGGLTHSAVSLDLGLDWH